MVREVAVDKLTRNLHLYGANLVQKLLFNSRSSAQRGMNNNSSVIEPVSQLCISNGASLRHSETSVGAPSRPPVR